MNKYLTALENLSHTLKKDKNKDKLKEIEQQIFQNEAAIKLIDAFQKAQEDYNFFLGHFANDKETLAKYKNLLIKAKKEMDEHPLIKEYNTLYFQIVEPTLYLESELHKIINIGEEKSC